VVTSLGRIQVITKEAVSKEGAAGREDGASATFNPGKTEPLAQRCPARSRRRGHCGPAPTGDTGAIAKTIVDDVVIADVVFARVAITDAVTCPYPWEITTGRTLPHLATTASATSRHEGTTSVAPCRQHAMLRTLPFLAATTPWARGVAGGRARGTLIDSSTMSTH
jgi:hypothetical protein